MMIRLWCILAPKAMKLLLLISQFTKLPWTRYSMMKNCRK
nr:MAG TPA: hypothetical protein [Bacteriophage sp.]